MILAPVLYNGATELVVEISPTSFSELVSGASGTTGSVTATVNGAAPFAITWLSNTGDLVATSPNSATTTFDYTGLTGVLDSIFATFEVAVSDASGNVGTAYYSAAVTRIS